MPRVYHVGIKGTFMTRSLHRKYFLDIAVSTDATVQWTSQAGQQEIHSLPQLPYNSRMYSDIDSAFVVTDKDVSKARWIQACLIGLC